MKPGIIWRSAVKTDTLNVLQHADTIVKASLKLI